MIIYDKTPGGFVIIMASAADRSEKAGGTAMETKKQGNNWTAYRDPETERYFAEIMYTSREGREQYDYEITQDMFRRLGTFGDDAENERLIRTARMTYSFENTMYGTLGPERTVWDEEANEAMKKTVRDREDRKD